MRTPPAKSGRALLAVIAAMAVLAGCGGSDAATGAARGPDPATGEPISVGFLSSDSGHFGQPAVSAMARAAAEWINGRGGIGGRPLKLEVCSTDGTPASSTKCATDLVGKKVLTVLNGNDGGLDAAQPILAEAGIHIFGSTGTPLVSADPGNTVMGTPPAVQLAANGPVQKLMGIRKAVFVLPNIGSEIKRAFDGIKDAAAAFGVRLTLSLVAPANPDITAAVNAAKATDADGLVFSFTESDCTNAIGTARALKWAGSIVGSNCTRFIKDLGPQAAGVKTMSSLFPFGSRASAEKYDSRLKAEFDDYEAAAEAAGARKYLDDGFATSGYSTVMTFAKILRTIDGRVTRASAARAMASFKGRQVLGTPQNCAAKLLPGANCGRHLIALEAHADGTQTLVGGKPLDVGALMGGR
ncbi:ABC transporter substrate-binding protein [Streptomyces flavofungini]|uniref:ABC transporter substrate-binding protein n=1 Tax=Streptomyces flavofungini TaxID=68200 RepID=UPI0034DE2DCC